MCSSDLETEWYAHHFAGSWNIFAVLLAVGHFAIPFILFMSRHAKRNLTFNAIMMCWLLFMHFIDVYWLIMPNLNHHGFHFSAIDLFCLLGIGGIFIGATFSRMKQSSLYPYKDPRIKESINFENA